MSGARLKAPADDGSMLAVPPLAQVGELIDSNRSSLNSSQVQIGGISISNLRRLAVREAIEASRRYHREAGEPVPDVSSDSLLLAGHQPELFHPGVWLKNFALNHLARVHSATPLNLIVDNDVPKTPTVRLPILGPRNQPSAVHLTTLPFDHSVGEVAYEERVVHDEEQFAALPTVVAERTKNWGFSPILSEYWRDVQAQRDRTRLLGERLAAGRRIWERRWGCHNCEVPISRLCATESFARFSVAIIADLPRFHQTYNAATRDYRRRHAIRSDSHPVPDLQKDGEWLEAPFWAWRTSVQRRGRLFVRPIAAGWELRVEQEKWPDLPTSHAVEAWRRLGSDGFKIRTRALTTTLFARLCLGDLFVHGIGGAKYDELTDAILQRHFGIEPPSFQVLTGTLRLPLPAYPATQIELRDARRLERDIRWNPQRHLGDRARELAGIVKQRQRLEAERPERAAKRREWFAQFRLLTERLQPAVVRELNLAKSEAQRVTEEVAANDIICRRDFAFCLFPEAKLREFLTRWRHFDAGQAAPPI